MTASNRPDEAARRDLPYRLGVDIGGTFTDMLLMDSARNRIYALKTPTSPNPEDAVIDGLEAFERSRGVSPDAIGYFSHRGHGARPCESPRVSGARAGA